MDAVSIGIICAAVFLAGFIDAIAGGGGLISLPAYMLVGVPPHMALGTNKFTAVFGTLFSVIGFMKNGKIHYLSAVYSMAGAFIGSYAGVRLALMLDEKYLKYILAVFLPCLLILIMKKRNFGEEDTSSKFTKFQLLALSFLIGIFIGTYDGFFGPGTGTFLILAYSCIIGFDVITSSGNAKMVNLASNISAAVTFFLHGKVILAVGIPAAIMGIAGNLIGTKLAIKNGAAIIRPAFLFILVLLLGRVGYDIMYR